MPRAEHGAAFARMPDAIAAAPRRLRVLIVTTLFPNRARPGWAPFNLQQFAALADLPGVRVVDVLATLPWFPAIDRLAPGSTAAGLRDVPPVDAIGGLRVRHPRVLYVPRVGHRIAARLFALSLARHVGRYRGEIDVVLAAWAHPDGCAAVLLGERLGVPVVVKAHGSDVNVGATLPGPQAAMRRLLPRASRIVVVSRALAKAVAALGVERSRIDVVRNGVDRTLFRPREASSARRDLGWPHARTVLCPGRVEHGKGVFDLLDAFDRARSVVPDARLVYVGGGEALGELRAEIARRALGGSVQALGAVPFARMPTFLAAATVVAVPSWAEGLPNTVLEALACGRPVVATDVGGIAEVVSSPQLGVLVPPRDADALAAALVGALERRWDPGRIAAASGQSWHDSAEALRESLARAVEELPHAPQAVRDASRGRRGLRRAGLLAVLLVVAFLVSEGTLRALAALSPQVAQMLTPGTVEVVPDPELGHRPSPATPGHDAWGFRNPAVPEHAEIVVLGDSQTYGEGVPAESAWPRVLARRSDHAVYALAYGGFGPAHYWLLRDEALSLEPRVLLVALYLGNDLYDAYALARRGGAAAELMAEGERPAGDALGERARAAFARTVGADDGPRRWLVRNLATVALGRAVYHELVRQNFPPAREAAWLVARYRARRSNGEHQVVEANGLRTVLTPRYRLVGLDVAEPGVRSGLDVSLEALRRLDDEARRKGARLAVVLIPTKEAVFEPLLEGPRDETERRLAAGEEAARQRLTSELDALSVPTLDLLPGLRALVRHGRNPYPENADGHPSPIGHEAIATFVQPWLAPLLTEATP